MSGVYIKGLDMPKRCGDCPFFSLESAGNAMWWDYCKAKCGIVDDPDNAVSGDCPLIPVPDHGRLIDADALTSDLVYPSEAFKRGFEALINDASTIIPADKEGEHG